MSIFEGLIQINEKGEIEYNKWIEWDHFFIPNKPEWFREILRNLLFMLGHCLNCSAIDGCYFLETKMPNIPLHNRCHCAKKNITYSKVKQSANAECDIRKFTEYIFKNNQESNGKKKIFSDLGFDINDSNYLQREFCDQALEQYLLGNYTLKNLDIRGQRLAIPINLKGTVFYSGWMLCPEGKIKNTTPFGGWVK